MADDVRYPSEMIDRLEDEDVELLDHLVTEEEVQLLDPKYYYISHYVNHSTENDRSLIAIWNSISYPLVVIRKAYVNLMLRKEETHILEVLKDKHLTLICSTTSFRSMKEYTLGVREILDSFYQNTYVQAAGFLKPSLPRKFRFGEEDHCIRGSIRNHHILLFLKEILGILLGNDQFEVYEGHTRLGSAELMGLVETCVKQLYAELKQEHDLLIRLIRTVHGEYAHNKDVFAAGLSAYKERNKLYEKLHGHALNAYLYFQNSVEADEMMKIFLPVFISFSATLRAGELPIYLEGFSPAPAPAPAPPTNSQRMMFQALQARATLQRPLTLGAGELPTYLGRSSPGLPHLTLTDSQRMKFEALKAKATLRKLSNSPATSYSPKMLQSQRRLASLQQRPSNSPATSYSSGMLQQSQWQLASLRQRLSNSPATSYSSGMLQQSQWQLASLQQRPSNSQATSYASEMQATILRQQATIQRQQAATLQRQALATSSFARMQI